MRFAWMNAKLGEIFKNGTSNLSKYDTPSQEKLIINYGQQQQQSAPSVTSLIGGLITYEI